MVEARPPELDISPGRIIIPVASLLQPGLELIANQKRRE
jgi:hypothetical protein